LIIKSLILIDQQRLIASQRNASFNFNFNFNDVELRAPKS